MSNEIDRPKPEEAAQQPSRPVQPHSPHERRSLIRAALARASRSRETVSIPVRAR